MQHLLLDLYGCNSQKLADADYLHRFLSEVPHLIHMQQVSPVHLDHITDVSDPRDAGHSGLVISASSHISLHAWPPYRMMNIDVFSCEPFDAAAVVAFACAAFEAADSEVQTIERATRSPRPSTPDALAPIEHQRRPSQSLDGCPHDGCHNRTGSVAIAYCEEHRTTHRQPPPMPRVVSS